MAVTACSTMCTQGAVQSASLRSVMRAVQGPRAIYTSGKGSSAAGLTASVNQDPNTREFYLEVGWPWHPVLQWLRGQQLLLRCCCAGWTARCFLTSNHRGLRFLNKRPLLLEYLLHYRQFTSESIHDFYPDFHSSFQGICLSIAVYKSIFKELQGLLSNPSYQGPFLGGI